MEWIRADERVPEDDRRVLCVTRTKKGVRDHVIAYMSKYGWTTKAQVTHWMELPEFPEEE